MPHARAISAEFWDSICPREKRRVISSKDMPDDAEGQAIIDWWIDRLKIVQDECVEIDSSQKVIFDRRYIAPSYLGCSISELTLTVFSFFDSSRVISLWPGLSASPILTDYLWSPLVQSAVSRNFAVLQPVSAKLLYSPNSTLSGLVAVHLRRGDYSRHCPRLAGWRSTYNGLNQYPSLPDKFDPTPYEDDQDARSAYYMQHCLPTVEQIVEKLRSVRAENPGLRRVYVLTNAWGWWLNGLKAALQKDGWEDLNSSLDVQLDAAQIQVAMAVDMAIAEKAEVFIGNGVSDCISYCVIICDVICFSDLLPSSRV
jgi:hypothetical protein